MMSWTNWPGRYMQLAKDIGSWSKDPRQKVGAIVVGRHGQILSQGYNGFPRGIRDSEKRLNDREIKLKYVVHAEMNAIFNASLEGISLENATMYVHGLPICHECAKGIIQVGIKKVVMNQLPEHRNHWEESCELAKKMLAEAEIEYEEIHQDL
jgi:dCMP deaminase